MAYSLLSISDVVALGAVSVVGYLLLCLLLWKTGARTVWWCLPIAGLLSFTYALNVLLYPNGTVYGGLLSDQTASLAYVRNIIEGNYLGAYFEKDVPAAYPPLYFWIVGSIARAVGSTSLQIWRWFPLLLLSALPFLAFAIGRQMGSARRGFYACFALLALGAYGAPHFWGFYPFEYSPNLQLHYALIKPHEFLGAMLLVLWCTTFVRGPARPPGETASGPQIGWTVRQVLLGAAVFLLYSPWFGLAVVTLGIHGLFGSAWASRRRYLGQLIAVTALCVAVTSIHWLPYLWVGLTTGFGTSVGSTYFRLDAMDPSWVTVGMGYFGLLFFLGLLGFAQLRKHEAMRALLIAATLVYAWYFSTYLTQPLLGSSFLPHRCHLVLTVVFAFASAMGLEAASERLFQPRWKKWFSAPALATVAVFLIPNVLVWNHMTDRLLVRTLRPVAPDVQQVVRALDEGERLTVVGHGWQMARVSALSKARLYLSWTPAHANPLAHYSESAAELHQVVREARDGEMLAAGLDHLGIDALLVTKDGNGGGYIDYYITTPARVGTERPRGLLLRLLFGPRDLGAEPEQYKDRIVFRAPLLQSKWFERVVDGPESALYMRVR